MCNTRLYTLGSVLYPVLYRFLDTFALDNAFVAFKYQINIKLFREQLHPRPRHKHSVFFVEAATSLKMQYMYECVIPR